MLPGVVETRLGCHTSTPFCGTSGGFQLLRRALRNHFTLHIKGALSSSLLSHTDHWLTGDLARCVWRLSSYLPWMDILSGRSLMKILHLTILARCLVSIEPSWSRNKECASALCLVPLFQFEKCSKCCFLVCEGSTHCSSSWIGNPVRTHKKSFFRETERATTDLNIWMKSSWWDASNRTEHEAPFLFFGYF